MQNLSDELRREITDTARACGVKELILFGSRARGDHHARSDIDLAIIDGDALRFKYELEERARTLLKFDVVDLSSTKNAALKAAIERDGEIIYDET